MAGGVESRSVGPTTSSGIWERQVNAWRLLGPPLRPCREDVAVFAATVAAWSARHGSARGLVLGATPELAKLPWPEGSTVLAVDRSQAMIERVWPGHPRPGQGGVRGDWSNLPLPSRACDLVLGDGPFTQLDYPDGYRKVFRSIRDVLTPDGVATIRFFVQPRIAESPGQVLADLWEGRIGNFHAFKWRLAMALQRNVHQGIALNTIWSYWADAVNPCELAVRLGWSREVIATMDNYRGLAVRYTFPTLPELRALLLSEFTEVKCHTPQYELGERCPIITHRPSAKATITSQTTFQSRPERCTRKR